MQKRIIAETEHVSAIEQDLGGDAVVVTFNELGTIRDGLNFWGDSFLLKQQISSIGIVTPSPNWYPAESMPTVLAAIRKKVGDRKVITYGHSQGGYGALKFASALNASVALAFCPQWSINPDDVSAFDRRFARYFDGKLRNGYRIEQGDVCSQSFIFFDPSEADDQANATPLLALGGVRQVIAPFTGHETVRIITEGHTAARLIRHAIDTDAPDSREFRQYIRSARRQSKTYSIHTALPLITRTLSSAARPSRFLSRVVSRLKEGSDFYRALVQFALGDLESAKALLVRMPPMEAPEGDLIPLWTFVHKLGFDEAELVIADRILARARNNTLMCLHAVNTLSRLGHLERARSELLRIAKHRDAGSQIAHFVDFSRRVKTAEAIEIIAGAESLRESIRVDMQFMLAALYMNLGDRPRAFRTAIALRQRCPGSPPELQRKVARLMSTLGESSLALELLEPLLRRTPEDSALALEVIAARPHSDKDRALTELSAIARLPSLPASSWTRISHLYQGFGNMRRSIQAARQAVRLGGSSKEEDFEARRRLAALLIKDLRPRAARTVLQKLLKACDEPRWLKAFGDLALEAKAPKLAERFAMMAIPRTAGGVAESAPTAPAASAPTKLRQASRLKLGVLFSRILQDG